MDRELRTSIKVYKHKASEKLRKTSKSEVDCAYHILDLMFSHLYPRHYHLPQKGSQAMEYRLKCQT